MPCALLVQLHKSLCTSGRLHDLLIDKNNLFGDSDILFMVTVTTGKKLMNAEEQFKYLSWGVEQFITREDFRQKRVDSEKTGQPLVVKLGVDPTAPDIHFGHTVVLRKLRQFQDAGHQAVLLIGGFTSQIGDPSGKSKTRPALSPEEIKVNAATYLEQVEKILIREKLQVVDNSDWLNPMTLKDMIKLLSQATMSKILEHNTFKDRFKEAESIRMHEFIYPFLQAYDSIHLKADIELGGTDQLFNIALGRELQKEYGQRPQSALLMPVLTGTDGLQKMSKSLGNYIGVNESPKVMAQKLLNMPDKNIVMYFQLLTSVAPEEVLEIQKKMEESPSTEVILGFKNRLVEEILKNYHPGSSASSTDVLEISSSECTEGRLGLMKAMQMAGFIKSNREGMQFLQNGAVRVADQIIQDKNFEIDLSKGEVMLNVGKKKFIQLKLKA